jgi:hypothetical protein
MRKCALVVPIFVCLLAPSLEARTLTLVWDPNTEPDIAGYLLSYGTVSGQYTSTIDLGNVTSYVFSEPNPLLRYFVALRAYNRVGAVSPYSAELATQLAPPVLTVTGLSANRTSPQLVGTGITFSAITSDSITPLQFKWWIENDTASTVGQQWSPSNMFTWTPTFPGANYTIRVWAREVTSTADAPDNPGATLSMTFTVRKRIPTPGPR